MRTRMHRRVNCWTPDSKTLRWTRTKLPLARYELCDEWKLRMIDNLSFGKRITFGLIFGIMFWGAVALSSAYQL